jgi:hypothetical protein
MVKIIKITMNKALIKRQSVPKKIIQNQLKTPLMLKKWHPQIYELELRA